GACGGTCRAWWAPVRLRLAIAAAAWPSGAEAAASAPAAWPALLPAGLPGDGPATSVRLVDDAAGFSTGMPHEAAGFPAAGPTDDAAALPPEAERLEAHWTAIMNEYGDYFAPGARPPFRELVAPDGGSPKTADVLAGLMRFFFHDIVRHGRLLVSIVVLTVLSSVLQTLQGAFERQAVSRIAYGICYLVILIMAVDSFRTAISYAEHALRRKTELKTAAAPLVLATLTYIRSFA